MSVDASDLRLTRLDKADYQRGVEVALSDDSWVGAAIKLRAETELIEEGRLVLEIETEGEAQDVEIGGIVLTGGPVGSKASASLSPEEARALANALLEQAEFLGDYRAGIARSA